MESAVAPGTDSKPRFDWKRLFIKAAGVGVGIVFAVALLAGGIAWYSSRPKPPKPWRTDVITAEYDKVDTEGDKPNLAFYYTLVNNSDDDYQLTEYSPVTLAAKLKEENSISSVSDKGITIDYPVFVPAHGRARFVIHIPPYGVGCTEPKHATADERHDYRIAVAQYVTDELANLDGFVFFDETHRYQVVFPDGWRETAKKPVRGAVPVVFCSH